MTDHPAPVRLIAVVELDLPRGGHVHREIECAADTDLEEVVRDVAVPHLHPLRAAGVLATEIADRYHGPTFTVEMTPTETGAVDVRLSSGRPGYDLGDFGRGRITWRDPS